MEYIKGRLDFHVAEPTVLSIGKFDGLHRGHELLMDYVFQKKKEGMKAVIFTFDVPPKKSLEQDAARVLTTNEEKMHLFEQIGIDYLIECPFTEEIMHMPAEEFLKKIVEQLSIRCIVAGTDCSFGYQRRGDYRMLQKYAPEYHYEAQIVDKMQYEGRDSSRQYGKGRAFAWICLFRTGNGCAWKPDRQNDRDSDDQSAAAAGKTAAAVWRICRAG